MRPAFSFGSVPGVDSAILGVPGRIRVGTLLQYERQPVVASQGDTYTEDVVTSRLIATTGVSVAFGRRVAGRLTFPIATQEGGTLALAPPDGAATGDLETGIRVLVYDEGATTLAASTDVALPVGTADAWMGEPYPRLRTGALAGFDLGRLVVFADAQAMWRTDFDPTRDLDWGSSLHFGAAGRYEVAPSLSLTTALVTRTALGPGFAGAAETPSELLAGVLVGREAKVTGAFGGGLGLSGGVGASRWRLYGGLTVTARPRVQEERCPCEAEEPEPEPDEEEEVVREARPAPPRAWMRDELVRANDEEILLRDPIQFAFGTAEVLPDSLPTLDAIASLLRRDAGIRSLLIEGHASDEGGFAYNFDLSERRARAIFMALVTAGVHPERLSYRGMGEVAPSVRDAGDAAERRVVFRIVARSDAGRVADGDFLLPWSGERVEIEAPPQDSDPFDLEEE